MVEKDVLQAAKFSTESGRALVRLGRGVLGVDLRLAHEHFDLRESPFGIDLDALVILDFSQSGLIQHIEVLPGPSTWIRSDVLSLPQQAEEAMLVFEKVAAEIQREKRRWLSLEDLEIRIEANPRKGVVRIVIGEDEESNYYRLAEEVIAGVGKESQILKEIWIWPLPLES